MDEPIQAMFQHFNHSDAIASGQTRKILSGNTDAIDLAAPAGDPASVEAHLKTLNDSAEQLIHQRLSQANDAADVAADRAATTSTGQKLLIGGKGIQSLSNKSQAVVNEVRAARDDAAAYADDAWDVARQGGFTTVRTPTQPIFDKIEAAMGRSLANHEMKADFPWEELSPLYRDQNPRGMFDNQGNRLPGTTRTGMGNHDNAGFGPTATLDELKTVDSNLARSIRAEQDKITTPGAGGNTRRLQALNEARQAVWGQIESGALQGGNYASLRAAMNATKLTHDTFDTGVIGRMLNTDVQGQAKMDPENALTTFLSNGPRGVANARALLDASAQRTGMAAQRAGQMPGSFDPQSPQARQAALEQAQAGTPSPAVGMQNSIADWLRQDFTLAQHEGGVAGAQKWLDNHSEFFEGTRGTNGSPFPQLEQDLKNSINTRQTALNLDPNIPRSAGARSIDDIQQSAAARFLGGDAGHALDRALGPNPYQGMKQLIAQVRQDGTGHAMNGLIRMMFDRTLAEGKVFTDTGGNHYYSGRASSAFRTQYAGAFKALAEADPIAGANMQKIFNAMDATDRINAKPAIPGVKDVQGAVNATTVGKMFAQIGGAKLAQHVLPQAGPMQAPALGSAFAGRAYDQWVEHMDMQTASSVLRDAMFDTDKLHALLQPANTPAAKAAVYHQVIEPFLRAAVVEPAQPVLNPSPEEVPTHPPSSTIGGPGGNRP